VDRAVRALLALTSVALLLSLGASPAASAQTSSVTMHLVRQSPWNTIDDPVLRISVDATNSGPAALDHLSVELTIGAPYDSRVEYESSLDEGPTSGFRTSHPCRGTLGSGATLTCRIELDLSTASGIEQTDSLVYPARLDLLSRDAVVGARAAPLL
jgi:hypothetical protein